MQLVILASYVWATIKPCQNAAFAWLVPTVPSSQKQKQLRHETPHGALLAPSFKPKVTKKTKQVQQNMPHVSGTANRATFSDKFLSVLSWNVAAAASTGILMAL